MTVPRGGETLRIKSLGTAAKLFDGAIGSVVLVGQGAVPWRHEADALAIDCPASMLQKLAVGFRVARAVPAAGVVGAK